MAMESESRSRRWKKRAIKAVPTLFDWLSLEWLLRFYPNGGFVIFLRSLAVSLIFFAIGLALVSVPVAARPLTWSWSEFGQLVSKNAAWLGAAFAAAYAAFYTRYAGQWSYLANLYNQIMATRVAAPSTPENTECLARWQVGFIADAVTLHLHRKELFAGVIRSMLARPIIMDEFLNTVPEPEKILRAVRFDPSSWPTVPVLAI